MAARIDTGVFRVLEDFKNIRDPSSLHRILSKYIKNVNPLVLVEARYQGRGQGNGARGREQHSGQDEQRNNQSKW